MPTSTQSPITVSPAPANDVAIVVRLPQDLREALKARAAAEDRSMASVMRLAARQYVESEVTL
ncbi:ribbon-helix-helix protein, CopG family [Nocardioides sp. zg-1230]|jgi:plasmid stability protein|uniref:ribbon-helix-helix domain-containing protein n=1 Tax=Nocardioides sp. zg-1230 TaxID=2736601 RepID=UPI001556C52D|nr:ribbon-helix-helix protein, CopG family [Nocardioides sp. zg-1230]NPC42847.1 CopG family transcriptional regulator [Nocardioides sp. zg-1230]